MSSTKTSSRQYIPFASAALFALQPIVSHAQFVQLPLQQMQEAAHPLSLSLDETLNYDSNPYRLSLEELPPGQDSPGDRSDVYSVTQAKMQYAYQSDGSTLSMRYVPAIVRYNRFSSLNHVRQSAGLRWALTPAERLSIVTAYAHSRLPSSLAEQQTTTPNMVTSDTVTTDLAFGGRGQWLAISGIGANASKNSDQQLRAADLAGWTAYVGVRRSTTAGTTADIRLRHTKQRHPNALGAAETDSYIQDEVTTNVDWKPTGISSLTGQFGYLTRKHDVFPSRDFNGWFGNARYALSFNGVSSAMLEIYRQLGEISEASVSYAKTDAARLSYTWKPTGKLIITPFLEFKQRNYSGIGEETKPNETTKTYALTSVYSITPSFALNATVGKESRKTKLETSRYSATYASMQLVWLVR